MKKTLLLMAAIVLLCTTLWALEDTPANRDQQADRYLAAMPVKEMMDDMVKQMSKFIPEAQRQKMQDVITKHLDTAAVEKAIKEAMIKNFTADELKALADFYSSPVGKSAMKKMGAYMADVMPAIQKEMGKAMEKANRAEAEKKEAEKADTEKKQ